MPRKFRERSARRSENVHDMTRSADPFFEVARRAGENQSQLKFTEKGRSGKKRREVMGMDSLMEALIRRYQMPEAVMLPEGMMFPDQMANYPNPFEALLQHLISDPSGAPGLVPYGPWHNEGRVTLGGRNTYVPYDQYLPQQWQSGAPPQRSLSAPKGDKPKRKK